MQFTQFSYQWQQWKENGFFKLFSPPFSPWDQLIKTIVTLAQEQDDPSLLLSALFQISGVLIPLQLSYESKNKIHQSWLQKLQTGDIIAAHCMTEAAGGTDIFAMQTIAKKHGEHWIINGSKTYICNAPVADMGLLYAKNDSAKLPYNLNCFLLDMSLPGVTISPPLEKVGLKNIPMGTIYLRDVKLSSENLVNLAGNGYHMVNMSTTFERLLIPIGFLGIMKKLYAKSHGLAKAEMYSLIYVAESLLQTTLSQINLGCWHRRYIQLGCLLKWQLSEIYIKAAKLSNDEIAYKDAISSRIYSGTNDVLRSTLSRLL